MPEPKLPQKLAELDLLLGEIEGGWLLKVLLRTAIDKVRIDRLEAKLAECVDASVDDYFTSRASEWVIEPQVRKMAGEWVHHVMIEVDRWAR